MSVYPNVVEQDLINLRKLTEQQKNQQAIEIKIGILKQTHDKKLAENLSPINRKIEEVIQSNKKLGELIETNSESETSQEIDPVEIDSDNSEDDNIQKKKSLPNNSIFSNSVRQMIASLMSCRNSLKKTQGVSGRANILDKPFQILGADRIQINDDKYDLTPEKYKALSSTSYTGKTMKNDNEVLMMNNIINDLGYTSLVIRYQEEKLFSQ